jgi:hypothetical protein
MHTQDFPAKTALLRSSSFWLGGATLACLLLLGGLAIWALEGAARALAIALLMAALGLWAVLARR